MLALPVVAALSFSAAPSARSAIHSRPIFMAASGLLTGEMVPAAALSALGIDAGQRAFVAFYCRDDGFQDKKQLQDLQDRTLSFAERQCVVGWFREYMEERVPDLDVLSLRTPLPS